MKVIIYVLIDPNTLKVRYIGRTSRDLYSRLHSHIHVARYETRKTHKESWIKSLLRNNQIPIIRKLTEVEGWNESYQLEVSLIEKYKDRLTNFYDRGPGSLRTCKPEDRLRISETLKQKYKDGLIERPKGKTVYVYNKDGSFLNEYPSIQETARQLNVYWGTVKKHVHNKIPNIDERTKDGRKRHLKTNYQYSFTKFEKMHNYNE